MPDAILELHSNICAPKLETASPEGCVVLHASIWDNLKRPITDQCSKKCSKYPHGYMFKGCWHMLQLSALKW